MNQERFDEMVKGLATNRLSRGQVLKGLGATLFAGGPLGAWWKTRLNAEAQTTPTFQHCTPDQNPVNNRSGATCNGFENYRRTTGVTDSAGVPHSGFWGWTKPRWNIGQTSSPQETPYGNNCLRVTFKFFVIVESFIRTLRWFPPSDCLNAECVADLEDWCRRLNAHENHHDADNHAIAREVNTGTLTLTNPNTGEPMTLKPTFARCPAAGKTARQRISDAVDTYLKNVLAALNAEAKKRQDSLDVADRGTLGLYCDACPQLCPPGQHLENCECVCDGGKTLCGGRCVDTSSDSSNCGFCGNACSGAQTCQSGTCQCPVSCDPPYTPNPITCQCECAISCSPPKVVNHDTCQCVCPSISCPPNEVLDPDTCACECPVGRCSDGECCSQRWGPTYCCGGEPPGSICCPQTMVCCNVPGVWSWCCPSYAPICCDIDVCCSQQGFSQQGLRNAAAKTIMPTKAGAKAQLLPAWVKKAKTLSTRATVKVRPHPARAQARTLAARTRRVAAQARVRALPTSPRVVARRTVVTSPQISVPQPKIAVRSPRNTVFSPRIGMSLPRSVGGPPRGVIRTLRR